MQHVAGEHLQKKRQQEARHDRAEYGQEPHRIVDPPVLVGRRHDAERDADCEGNDNRHQHQFESRGERFADIVVDRPLGQERQTEIAVGEPNREPLVLLRQRQIEPHLDLEILDLLLTCTRTERHARRIARHDPRDQEDRDGKPDQDEQRPEDSPDQKVDELHEAPPTLTPRALTPIIGRGARRAADPG
jgi:hypothetical protein